MKSDDMTDHVDRTRMRSKRKFVPDDDDTGTFLKFQLHH